MEIKATSKYDQKAITALTYLGMFRKHEPKKCMAFMTCLIGIDLVFSVYLLLFTDSSLAPTCFFVCVLVMLLQCYLFLWFPKVQYRAMGKIAQTSNTFCFTDDGISMDSFNDHYSGHSAIDYAVLHKVMETGEYFFLFQTKRQVIIVDKSTLQGGTAEDLRAKLKSTPNLRYILCKY